MNFNNVTDYSCAYNGRQGWLYISENYLGFYSFLLGVETKVLVELKDIQDMKKEKSKRNMFSDSLLIVTKDKGEVQFIDYFVVKDHANLDTHTLIETE